MLTLLASALPVFGLYLWLTAGSGTVLGSWAVSELVAGAVFSVLTGVVTSRYIPARSTGRILNPLRWVLGFVYVLGPFLFELTKANVDVAYRVITGRIRPGILRVKSGMATDAGALFLANSITLTPGTLTVDIDPETNDLFVHKINLAPGEEAQETLDARALFTLNCPAWVRRIAE